jgi:hypothetical protein
MLHFTHKKQHLNVEKIKIFAYIPPYSLCSRKFHEKLLFLWHVCRKDKKASWKGYFSTKFSFLHTPLTKLIYLETVEILG